MFIGIAINLTARLLSSASPASLFANGEVGVWYDPSDITTLFQDSAGTIPVTAAGQSVRRMLDKSGRGNHATQAVLAQAPTYQIDGNGFPYLLFDGVDDGMVTSAINFTVTDAVTIWAGLRKQSDAARACFVELGISMATGRFNIEAPSGALNDIALFSGGTALQAIGAVVAAPSTRVMSGQAKISTDLLKIRLNGVDAGSNSADQGTGNYSNSILFIGRRGGTTLPFNGRIYSLIIRGVESTQGQITSTESWVNSKTGAY
jgi:hypothetical protein